jgi:hypothetical protein
VKYVKNAIQAIEIATVKRSAGKVICNDRDFIILSRWN